MNDIHSTAIPRRTSADSLAAAVLGADGRHGGVAVIATAVVADNIGDWQGGSLTRRHRRAGSTTGHAKKVLHGAADSRRGRARSPDVPRDDQFIYTKNVTKETDRKTGKSKTYTDETWKSVDRSKRSWERVTGRGQLVGAVEGERRPSGRTTTGRS